MTPVTETAELKAGNYVLDPQHARVNWSLSHAGLSQYTARFDEVSGALEFDPADPEASRLDIRINPKSVSTGLPEFDETLATSGNYFDADTYPEIRFASSQITKTSETTGQITGHFCALILAWITLLGSRGLAMKSPCRSKLNLTKRDEVPP